MADSIKKIVEVEVDVKSGDVKILDRDLNKVVKTTKKLNDQSKATQDLQSKGARLIDKYTGGLLTQAQTWFKMGKAATTALTGIKTGLVSTGIGALVVGLGLVVAYWDDIAEYIGFANDEQEDLNNQTDDYNNKIRKSAELVGKYQLTYIAQKKAEAEANGEVIDNLEAQKRLLQDKQKETSKDIDNIESVEKVTQRINQSAVDHETKILELKGESYNLQELLAKHTSDVVHKLNEAQKTQLKALQEDRLKYAKEIDEITKQQGDNVINQIDEETSKRTAGIKRLQALWANYFKTVESLDQTHQLSLISNDNDRLLKALEFEKQNNLKSLEDSNFTEDQKTALKVRYERQYLDKKRQLTDQWQKEDQARLQGYLDDAKKIREDNETEFFTDLEKLREGMRQSGLSPEQLEIEAAEAKYFRLIELAEQYGEDVTDLETAQAKEVADIEKKYANQIKEDKIEATQASLNVATNATTSLMMMNDMLVENGLVNAKKGFAIQKSIAITEAVISTANASISAYKSVVGVPYVGPILAPIAAGVAVAAGSAQIGMIASQKFDGGGSASVSSPSSGGSALSGGGAPQFNTVGQSGFNQVAGSIADQNQQPVKAYVVATDVTSQQSLDRNSRNKSAF